MKIGTIWIAQVVRTFVFILFFMTTANAEDFIIADFNTLQDALTTAAGNGEDDLVDLPTGEYTVPATLIYDPTDVENQSLTIQGKGAGSTVLNGANLRQILKIYTEDFDEPDGHFIIDGITFQNGRNAGLAAGLYVHSNYADITIENCEFKNNTSTGSSPSYDGGGLKTRCQTNATIILKNNTFTGNSASEGGGACIQAYGFPGATVILENNTFSGNNANYTSGGVYAYSYGPIAFKSNSFTGNSATYSFGGARVETRDGTLILINNFFSGNSVNTYIGGGAYATTQFGTAIILNNTFSGSNTAQGNGGGLYVHLLGDGPAKIYNNILWGNTANGAGDDLYISNRYAQVELYNNLYGDAIITDDDKLTEGNNHTNEDPLLTTDFYLGSNSPCIDAGTNNVPDPPGLPAADIEDNDRVSDGDGNGSSIVDIGAYEYSSSQATINNSGIQLLLLGD